MVIQDRWLRVPLASIKVPRDRRQRRAIRGESGEFLDGDKLRASIRDRGVINAIIVREDFTLVAGERRLEASRDLGLPDIPVRFLGDLSPEDQELVELDENLRRLDLPWQDEVAAIARLHELHSARDPAWTAEATSALLGGYSQMTQVLRVAPDLASPKLANAGGVRAAYNILSRVDNRAAADAVSDIIDASTGIFAAKTGEGASSPLKGARIDPQPASVTPSPAPSILCEDFLQWAPAYRGPTFNLIHCDFPYGIEIFAGSESGRDSHITYDDSEASYRGLIETLCLNLPRLLSHSGHLIFWLSSNVELQWRTLEMFRALAPSLQFHPKPLIWHKTDNVGILADSKRGPRHVYETALMASQEDRPILHPTSDIYGAPTDKAHHSSTKPEPMLRYFFQMFVDDGTRLLDPTCGSGSALRAAESLGASYILGLEKDPTHAESARSALRSFRALRGAKK